MKLQLLIYLLAFPLLVGCGGYQSGGDDQTQGNGSVTTPQTTVVGDINTVNRIKDAFAKQLGNSQGVSGMGVGGNSNLDSWIVIMFASASAGKQFQNWATTQKTYHFEDADGYFLLYISNTQAVRVYTQVTGNIQAQ